MVDPHPDLATPSDFSCCCRQVASKSYAPGAPATGTVTKALDDGLFVEIEDGVEGLCHISQLAVEPGPFANARCEPEPEARAAFGLARTLGWEVLESSTLVDEACLPSLRPGEGVQVLFRINAMVIGIQHMAEPAPVIAQALEQGPGDRYAVAFEDQLVAMLGDMYAGLLRRPPE